MGLTTTNIRTQARASAPGPTRAPRITPRAVAACIRVTLDLGRLVRTRPRHIRGTRYNRLPPITNSTIFQSGQFPCDAGGKQVYYDGCMLRSLRKFVCAGFAGTGGTVFFL